MKGKASRLLLFAGLLLTGTDVIGKETASTTLSTSLQAGENDGKIIFVTFVVLYVLHGTSAYHRTGHPPTLRPEPADKYRYPLDHRKSEGYVTCSNGMVVFLPYTKKGPKGQQVRGAIEMLVQVGIQLHARAPTSRLVNGCCPVKMLPCLSSKPRVTVPLWLRS